MVLPSFSSCRLVGRFVGLKPESWPAFSLRLLGVDIHGIPVNDQCSTVKASGPDNAFVDEFSNVAH